MAFVMLSSEVGDRIEKALEKGLYVSGKDIVINGIASRFEELGVPGEFVSIEEIFTKNKTGGKVPLAMYTGMIVITPKGFFHTVPSLRHTRYGSLMEPVAVEVARLAANDPCKPGTQMELPDSMGQLHTVENLFTVHERSSALSGTFVITRSVIRWEVRTANSHDKFVEDFLPMTFFELSPEHIDNESLFSRLELIQSCIVDLTPSLGVEQVELASDPVQIN